MDWQRMATMPEEEKREQLAIPNVVIIYMKFFCKKKTLRKHIPYLYTPKLEKYWKLLV